MFFTVLGWAIVVFASIAILLTIVADRRLNRKHRRLSLRDPSAIRKDSAEARDQKRKAG